MNDKAPIITKEIPLSEIVTTDGTQVRAEISEATVQSYADDMANGDKFPNVVVFHDGSKFVLSDGFHRVLAMQRLGWEKARVEIHKGTRVDALRYGLSANYSHGLRRTIPDKKKSVQMAMIEWPKLSDREFAKICAVSHPFVAEVRQLVAVTSCQPQTRIGADGRERRVPTRKPRSEPAQPAEPEPKSPAPSAAQQSAPPTDKGEDAHASGVGKHRNFFASQLEDITDAIIDDASDEQLSAAILQSRVVTKKLLEAQKQRQLKAVTK